jgi:UDP-GlcNAc:undecaprenyl-phosphate/decaprenyl-phosphate GlcNAc-1-phosphate transferase
MPFFFEIFSIFIASVICSPLIVWGVSYGLRRYGILDRPEKYKTEKWRAPAPYSIGISVFLSLAIFIPVILYFSEFPPVLEKRLIIMFILSWILTLVSFIDDLDTIGKSRLRVPPLFRLSLQILIWAIIGMTSIKISYISWVFWGILDLTEYFWTFQFGGADFTIYIIPLLLTIFWYVLVFNAVNFSDWVPGLTGGFALISFVILASLAVKLLLTDTSPAAQENSHFLLLILAIIIPVTFAITRLDISRRWLIGDSGTIVLAFLIATLAIIAGGKIATAMSVLWVYLIDLIYVVGIRIMKGQNPMKWDQTHHLHYRLMELGFSASMIRNTIYFLTAFFGITAIFLDTRGKIALFVFIAFVTLFLTRLLSLRKK